MYLPKFDKFKELDKIVNDMTTSDWQTYRTGKAERQREFMIQDKNKTKAKGDEIIFEPVNKKAYDFYRKKRRKVSEYFSLRSTYSRLALNNPVQTYGSHMLKLALSVLFEWIIENNLMWKVLICNSVHDEIVLQCPKEMSEEVNDVLGKTMVACGNAYLKNLTIKADSAIGTTWYNAKKG